LIERLDFDINSAKDQTDLGKNREGQTKTPESSGYFLVDEGSKVL